MRRNDDIELFSMSFLDLISCAMAGVLVLYTVADRSAGQATRRKEAPAHVTLTFKDELVGRLGFSVRLTSGTRSYEGSSTRRTGQWIIKENPLTAKLLLDEPLRADATLVVYVEDFDLTVDPATYKETVDVSVVVYSPKRNPPLTSFTMKLERNNAFRAERKI